MRTSRDHEKSDYGSMTSLKTHFKGLNKEDNFLIGVNMILKQIYFMILILVCIRINHQNLIRKEFKMSLSLELSKSLKISKLKYTRILSLK
jgi:hypothetical protein